MTEKMELIEKRTVGAVLEKIKGFQDNQEIQLPPNYSPANALKSAWLILQQTVDKNREPVLQSCTGISIVNCLLDMVIQGLNPAKKQCYFIAYGKSLTLMRSYFGSMALVKNITGAKEIYSEIIYEGDKFNYSIKNGRKTILQHSQEFDSIDSTKIIGAYCVIVFPDDQETTEIMSRAQIDKAWKKSRADVTRQGSVHQEFTEEMCKRTVINRACKKIINSSSDNAILVKAANRADETLTDEKVDEEVREKANKETIDVSIGEETEGEAKEEKVENEITKVELEGEPGF